MSETIKQSATVPPVAFSRVVRGIIRKEAEAIPNTSVLETRDFKIGPYAQVEVVKTGKEDYQALVMSHKDECGLEYVMKLAKIQGHDFIKEGLGLAPASEFGDVSVLPETVQEGKQILAEGDASKAKIEAMAKSFGMTSDAFLSAFADGTLADKIKTTQEATTKTTEGGAE